MTTTARTPESQRSGGKRPTVAETIRILASKQKTSAGAPGYSRWVNRPIGRVLAAVSFRLGLTPNLVTAISASFSFAGIAVLALVPVAWWSGVLVAALLVIGYAFDSADGQLARLRGGGSPAGEWLDHMVDASKISALHLAVAISLYRYGHLSSVGWLLIPLGFTVVANGTFFGMILTEQLRRAHGAEKAPVRRAGTLRSLLVLPTDYGLLCLLFLLLGARTAFLVAYSVIFAGNLLFCVKWIKWFRDMSALSVDQDRP